MNTTAKKTKSFPFYLLFAILLIGNFAFAQNAHQDSLIVKLNAATTQKQKGFFALMLAQSYMGENQSTALSYASKTLLYAQQAHADSLVGDALNTTGSIYYMNGDFDNARSFYLKATLAYQKAQSMKGRATSINNVGLTYINQGRYSEGLKYQFESLAIYDSIGNEKGIARSYNAIAVVYNELGKITKDSSNFSTALIFLKKCLLLSKKSNDELGYNNILLNLGNAFRSLNMFDSSQYYSTLALEMGRKRGDDVVISNALGNIADNYLSEKKYELAIENGEKALAIKTKIDDQLGMASVYIILSDAYKKTDRNKIAFEYIKLAYTLAVKAGAINEQAIAARELAKQQAEVGAYYEAFQMLDSYANLRDSITQKESKEIVQELKRFSDDDQKKQIELLTQKSQIAELKSNRQSLFLAFSVVGVILLLIGVILFYSRYKVKQRANKDLQIAYSLIEEKNKSITDSIQYAKHLQEAILPSSETVDRLFPDHFILYRPKDIVAGDFYWVEEFEGLIFFAAADCTGHGVPGALVSVVCSRALQGAVFQFHLKDPGKILDKATEIVLETFDRNKTNVNDGMDISLACWNPKTRELKWAGANNPLVYFIEDEMLILPADKQPIGRATNRKPFTTHHLKLDSATTLYLFTDGYADQFGGEKEKKFMHRQLLEVLQKIKTKHPSDQKNELVATFLNWKKELEQIDDVLVMGIKL